MNLFARLRRWLPPAPFRPKVEVPFNITCKSGHIVQGTRRHRHQIVQCNTCGEDVFVLPRSPWPDADARADGGPKSIRSPWRGPAIAGTLTLVAVLAGMAYLLSFLSQKASIPQNIETHIEAGRRALTEGKLRLAAQEFREAHLLCSSDPDSVPAARVREIEQLRRQTALLPDLLSESLGEILLRSMNMQEDEWMAQFQQRYKGYAIIFDAPVRRDGAGQLELEWDLRAGDEPARIDIGTLEILSGLPLNEPKRLLFGARLGRIGREQDGVWVVRFEPGSGVLLTDRMVAASCCPMPLEEDLLNVLDQQLQWLSER